MHLRDSSQNETPNLQWSHVILPRSGVFDRSDYWGCLGPSLRLEMGFLDQVCKHLTSTVGHLLISISAPLCFIAIIVIAFAMPTHFGLDQHTPSFRTRASYRSFANLDLVGSLLIMAGSFLLVTVLNEANLAFPWGSGSAITLIVLTAVAWVAFFSWECYISDLPGKDPIFPKRWLFERPWMGILLWVNFVVHFDSDSF